jgi:hypothetical protein
MKKTIWIWLILLFMVGCNEDVAVTEMPASPPPTTNPTHTPLPDAISTLPPPPTPVAEQLATPTTIPVATITVTPSPSPTTLPTAEPVALFSATDFGDNRSPFTGLVITDTENLQRRPLNVKISNAPARWVRPQSGLSQADLVFEHIAEGATRFTAIFHSQTPPDIGPIRSARLIDLDLPEMYDAALVYSGSSIGVSELLGESDFRPRILRSNEEGYYRTGADKPVEHTLYADPTGLWNALEAKGENVAPQLGNIMPFSELPPPNGDPTVQVNLNYDNENTLVEWQWDADIQAYRRWTDGEPHIDANTDEQITAKNVVILIVPHELDRNICEYQTETSCQAFSMAIQFWHSEGRAILLRDGLRYEGRWQRFGLEWMIDLVNDANEPLPFQLGNTFFQVIPPHYEDLITFE